MVIRFYVDDIPETLYDEKDNMDVVPMVGDKIRLNEISFVVVSRLINYDYAEVNVTIKEQPYTP